MKRTSTGVLVVAALVGAVVGFVVDQLLTGAGRVELRLAADGDDGQLLWSADLAGSARVLIDASLVEIFPDAATSFTLRAYPADGERYRLVTAPGVQVSAWSLRTPGQ